MDALIPELRHAAFWCFFGINAAGIWPGWVLQAERDYPEDLLDSTQLSFPALGLLASGNFSKAVSRIRKQLVTGQ